MLTLLNQGWIRFRILHNRATNTTTVVRTIMIAATIGLTLIPRDCRRHTNSSSRRAGARWWHGRYATAITNELHTTNIRTRRISLALPNNTAICPRSSRRVFAISLVWHDKDGRAVVAAHWERGDGYGADAGDWHILALPFYERRGCIAEWWWTLDILVEGYGALRGCVCLVRRGTEWSAWESRSLYQWHADTNWENRSVRLRKIKNVPLNAPRN